MNLTMKILIGIVALALVGVNTVSAQTGALQGRELFLFDNGTGSTKNSVSLVAPADADLNANFSLTLPGTLGAQNEILVLSDNAGTLEFQDGLTLFWGIEGNCDPISPWDPITQTGNYIGHCSDDIDIISGGSIMNFWFNTGLTPVLVLDENGTMNLNTQDGYEGLVLTGSGPTGPDAGILIDCAFPPVVGIEVNSQAVGILMPTCAAPPLTGISLIAQTVGLDATAPTALWAKGGVDIDLAPLDDMNISGVDVDNTATNILVLDGSGNVRTSNRSTIIGADEGLVFNEDLGDFEVRLGSSVNGTNPITGTRYVRLNGGQLDFNTATNTNLRLSAGGTGINILGTGITNIGNPTGGTISMLSGSTITSVAPAVNMNNSVTGGATNIGNASSGGVNVASGADVTITVPGGASGNDLVLTGIDADATTTQLLSIDGAGNVRTRTIGTGDVVTGSGTINNLTKWSPSGTELADANITDDGTTVAVTSDIISLTSTGGDVFISSGPGVGDQVRIANVIGQNSPVQIGHNAAAAGQIALNGPDILIRPFAAGDFGISTLGNDESDVQLLSRDAITGVVSYRSVAANGTIVTSAGTLGNNEVVYTNATGQLTSAALTNGQILIGASGGAPSPGNIVGDAGITVTNTAGGIELDVDNPVPAGTVTNSTLRWDGFDWVENTGVRTTSTFALQVDNGTVLGNDDTDGHVIRGVTSINGAPSGAATTIGATGNITNLNSATINAPNLPSTGLSTDEFVVTDGTVLRTASVTTMIGGVPWVVGGNTVAPANGRIGINTAAAIDLEFFVNGSQAASINNSTLKMTVNNDFEVGENTTLGSEDSDIIDIWGVTSINTTGTATTSIGSVTSGGVTIASGGTTAVSGSAALNLTSGANVNVAPAGDINLVPVAGDVNINVTSGPGVFNIAGLTDDPTATEILVLDGSGNVRTRDISADSIVTGSGTTNTLTKWTSNDQIGDASITDDGTTVEFSTIAVEMPNLPDNPSNSNWIVTYNNTTGALEKKDLGTPVAKTKSSQALIVSLGVALYDIPDTFVAAGATITCTLQDGTDANDYIVTLTAVNPGVGFSIRLSGAMAVAETKIVHYTITNP